MSVGRVIVTGRFRIGRLDSSSVRPSSNRRGSRSIVLRTGSRFDRLLIVSAAVFQFLEVFGKFVDI